MLRRLTRVALYGFSARIALAVILFVAGVRVGVELAPDPVVVVSPSVEPVQRTRGEAVAQAAPAPPPPAPPAQAPAETSKGEAPAATPDTDPCREGGKTESAPAQGPTVRLDLNAATVDQLDDLPGIGPALARRIVEFRRQHGPFATVEDLVEVPGVGPKTLERLRALVRVGDH